MRDLRDAVRILGPKQVADHNDRGNEYQARGENDRAIAEFDEAIRLSPGLADLYANRGNAHAGKGHWEPAIAGERQGVRTATSTARWRIIPRAYGCNPTFT